MLARGITRLIDTGSLQRQVFLTLIAAVVLGVSPWLANDIPLTGSRNGLPLDAVSLLAASALIIATLATVWLHKQRFIALITIGVVGLVVSLAFVKFSAPDLALTQLSVEIVTIVLLLLALYFLPQHGAAEKSPGASGAMARLHWLQAPAPRPWPGPCSPGLTTPSPATTSRTACRAAAAATW